MGMTMSPETSMLVNCQMWQIQANECNPCQAPPGQQGSRANEAPLSSPPLPPGLHGGGEAIGGESIGFPIECRMVLASSRFTTTEDHSAHGPVIPTTVNASAVLNASVYVTVDFSSDQFPIGEDEGWLITCDFTS